MSDPFPRDDSPDTALARALHVRGEVPLEALRAALDEVRAERERDPGLTLAALLRRRGHGAAKEPGPGDRLGGYRILAALAEGGMGAVFEAEDARGARVALKTIRSDGLAGRLDAQLLARFRREVELLARLDHPHVVRIHAADLEGATPYLVQDLLPGGSLADRLRRGPLPVADALGLAEKLGRALEHAHRHGVLHRDLKPANILFDDRGEPRLVDFGLARSLAEGSLGPTRSGEALGTPSYMAPEQVLGRTPDERTDMWGLGGVLYACLTGRPPFEEKAAVATMDAVVNGQLVSPRALRREVPPAVEALVLAALRKEPAERIASARELVRSLRLAREPGRAGGALARALGAALLLLGVGALVLVLALLAPGTSTSEVEAPGPPRRPSREAAPTAAVPAEIEPYPVGTLLWMDVFHWTSARTAATATIGSLTLAIEARVESIEGDTTRLAARIVDMSADFDFPDTGTPKLEFDSARPDEASPLFRPLQRFAGAPFALTVDYARGAVRGVSGLDRVCDRTLAEVTELCAPRGTSDPEVKLLVEVSRSLLATFHDDRLREMFDLFVDVGPLLPQDRWTRERPLRTGLEVTPRRVTVELRRDGPRRLRWRTRRATDGFEASGEFDLDAQGRVVSSVVEDTTTTTGKNGARVQRRGTFRLTIR